MQAVNGSLASSCASLKSVGNGAIKMSSSHNSIHEEAQLGVKTSDSGSIRRDEIRVVSDVSAKEESTVSPATKKQPSPSASSSNPDFSSNPNAKNRGRFATATLSTSKSLQDNLGGDILSADVSRISADAAQCGTSAGASEKNSPDAGTPGNQMVKLGNPGENSTDSVRIYFEKNILFDVG